MMNYFMDEDINQGGLLEGGTPAQGSVNDIINDMIRSGYNPTKHKEQAIADMKRANIPLATIGHILGQADQAVFKQSKQAAQAQRKTLYTDAQMTPVAPVSVQ
jgi:hypothetical protein